MAVLLSLSPGYLYLALLQSSHTCWGQALLTETRLSGDCMLGASRGAQFHQSLPRRMCCLIQMCLCDICVGEQGVEGDETGTKFHFGVNWSCKINDLKLVVFVALIPYRSDICRVT